MNVQYDGAQASCDLYIKKFIKGVAHNTPIEFYVGTIKRVHCLQDTNTFHDVEVVVFFPPA